MKTNSRFFVLALPVAFMLTLATTSLAHAEDKSDGCGLGWQVTSKTSFLGTTTRGTTNVFIPPTFGMTSGTMGCARHSIGKKEEPAVRYVVENYQPLTMQLAEGRGEYLDGFARTMGCSSTSDFGRVMQHDFRSITDGGKADPFEMYDRVKARIKSDQLLSAQCS